MQQNKSQFMMDNYVEGNGQSAAIKIMGRLSAEQVAFVYEPWPKDSWRIYVRKDVKHILKAAELAIK